MNHSHSAGAIPKEELELRALESLIMIRNQAYTTFAPEKDTNTVFQDREVSLSFAGENTTSLPFKNVSCTRLVFVLEIMQKCKRPMENCFPTMSTLISMPSLLLVNLVFAKQYPPPEGL